MESHLWTFGHTLFQQSSLQLAVEQWGEASPTNNHEHTIQREEQQSTTEICVNQTFYLYLIVENYLHQDGASGLPSSSSSSSQDWEMGLKHVAVNLQLRHDQAIIPFRATPCHINTDSSTNGLLFLPLPIEKRSRSLGAYKNHSVFVLELRVVVDPQYYNTPIMFELTLDLKYSQELPFSRKLVTDSNERKIRMLIDSNRHSAPKCPPRSLSTTLTFTNPLQMNHYCHEMDNYSSILEITVKNCHSRVTLVIEDMFHHINQTRIDVEKILDHFPQNLDESFEAVSITENDAISTAVGSSSSSSASACAPSVGLMFEFVPLIQESRIILPPGAAKCVAFRILVRQEVIQKLHGWSGFIPFGRFMSPFTINWRVLVSKLSDSEMVSSMIQTHQSDLSWSISARTLETRNSTLLADLLRYGYSTTLSSYLSSYHPRSMTSHALLKVEIEGPKCVRLNEEFQLKLFVYNFSKVEYLDLMISTSSLQKSCVTSETLIESGDCTSTHPIIFRQSSIYIRQLLPGGTACVELDVIALLKGAVAFDSIALQFNSGVSALPSSKRLSPAVASHTSRRSYSLLCPYQLLVVDGNSIQERSHS